MASIVRSASLALVGIALGVVACSGFGSDDATTPTDPDGGLPEGGNPPVGGEASRGITITGGEAGKTVFVIQGRSTAVPIKLERRASSIGPVAITVGKLPANATADSLTIPAGANEGTLTLHAAATAPQGAVILDITALESVENGAGAAAKLSAFVRGTPGALDTTFATTGALLGAYGTGSDSTAVDAKVMGNGSILIGLRRVNNTALSRFTAAGVLDPTFEGGGTTNLNGSQSSMLIDTYEPAAPAKGFIYALDTGSNGGSPLLFHLNLDGALDLGFNGSGKVTVNDGLSQVGGVFASQMFALADGKALVLATHQTTGTTAVTRWNANGTRDDTYGTASRCEMQGTGARMVLRPGGGVFVSMRKPTGGGALLGCTAAGARDMTIGLAPDYQQDTTTVEPFDFASAPFDGLAFITNLIVGPDTPYAAWSRVNSGLITDQSIGQFGVVKTVVESASSFIVQQDGGVLIGTGDGPNFKVVRYTAKGVLDADFGTGGTALFNVADTNTADLLKLVAQPDGRILAVGKHYDTVDAAIVRFWP